MRGVPDHPVIRNMERTGHPYGKEPETPRCPVCRSETDTLYRNDNFDIVGCDECLTAYDAWELMEDREYGI
jgi:hypothetical protein